MVEQQPAEKEKKWLAWFRNNVDLLTVAILLLLVPVALVLVSRFSNCQFNYWFIAIWFYVALALASFIPVWRAARRKVTKQDVDNSLSKAKETITDARPFDRLDDRAKEVMVLNFERLAGTLVFWKFEAEKYRTAHLYCLFWTIPSAVLIPILTQAAVGSSSGTTLVTVISAFTAILLAFHKGLKIEENYRAFRHGESEFYDLFRRILDRPKAFGSDSQAQLESYLIETETIRRFVRHAETNNMATLDEARQILKGTGKDAKKPRGDFKPRIRRSHVLANLATVLKPPFALLRLRKAVAALTEGVIQTMMMNKQKTMSAALLLLVSAGGLASHMWAAEPAEALTATTFAQYQKHINPQPGESRWMVIPWFLDLHAARQKAATEGKPLFIYSAGGATGIGAC